MPNVVKNNDRKSRRQARRNSRRLRRPGMFQQFKQERKEHRENAGPVRKALGVIPAVHAAYLLKDLKLKD